MGGEKTTQQQVDEQAEHLDEVEDRLERIESRLDQLGQVLRFDGDGIAVLDKVRARVFEIVEDPDAVDSVVRGRLQVNTDEAPIPELVLFGSQDGTPVMLYVDDEDEGRLMLEANDADAWGVLRGFDMPALRRVVQQTPPALPTVDGAQRSFVDAIAQRAESLDEKTRAAVLGLMDHLVGGTT